MRLLTKGLETKFQKVGRQDGKIDPTVVCKFFDPCGSWTWYATEYDPESRCFFGYVVGFEKEWGDFSLDELTEVRGPLGLGIERDRYFRSGPFSQVVPDRHKDLAGRC